MWTLHSSLGHTCSFLLNTWMCSTLDPYTSWWAGNNNHEATSRALFNTPPCILFQYCWIFLRVWFKSNFCPACEKPYEILQQVWISFVYFWCDPCQNMTSRSKDARRIPSCVVEIPTKTKPKTKCTQPVFVRSNVLRLFRRFLRVVLYCHCW